jgi:uncharacterized repeat protein (TIGR03803 family)
VYSLDTNGGGFTVLRHFAGPDGKMPYCELLLVSNVLYGTTAAGGDNDQGVVFQINTNGWSFSVLKSFSSSDGSLPLSGLTWSDGVLYGTTSSGGYWNLGTLFSVLPDGTSFVTLHHFDGVEGAIPRYSLAVSDNWIYGTTEGNGSQSLVYEQSTDGGQYQVLKTFLPPDPISGTNAEGAYLQSGLVASGGTLFGSTREGGYYGSGVVFALQMDGSGYSVLKHFSALTNNGTGQMTNGDGTGPGPLSLFGSTLYGSTKAGGAASVGTLFALSILPRIQLPNSNPSGGPNGFTFEIVGCSNQVVCVQASADLVSPLWLLLATNTIGNGPLQFSDPDATNYAHRFYRLQAQ